MLLMLLNPKIVPIIFEKALANKNQLIDFNSIVNLLYLIVARDKGNKILAGTTIPIYIKNNPLSNNTYIYLLNYIFPFSTLPPPHMLGQGNVESNTRLP